MGPVAQRIRAGGYEPRCRGFESLLAHNRPYSLGGDNPRKYFFPYHFLFYLPNLFDLVVFFHPHLYQLFPFAIKGVFVDYLQV